MSRVPLPVVPHTGDAALFQWMEAVQQRLLDATGEGREGEKALTADDLHRLGLLRKNGVAFAGGSGFRDFSANVTTGLDERVPAKVGGLTATGVIGGVDLAWTQPGGANIAYVEIHRASSNDRTAAALIGNSRGPAFRDAFGATGQAYWYWVRAVSKAGVTGEWSSGATAGVTATSAKVASDDLDIAAVQVAHVTVGQAALASAGTVNLVASSGAQQYRVRDLIVSGAGTSFTGGDRDIAITDGTSTWSVMPDSQIGSLAAGRWGDAILPFPATAAHMTAESVAGQPIRATYSGGTSDHSAGALTLVIFYERTA